MTLQSKVTCVCLATWASCITIAVLSWNLNGLCFLNESNWFSRSGAIIVIISAYLELKLLKRINRHHHWIKINEFYPKGSSAYIEAQQASEKHHIDPLKNIVNRSNILLIILGTLIWAYGDVVYKLCTEST